MIKKELISRSPLRILEQSTHGGVGKGNIGVIAARKGVGKTACLVHIATDQLFQGKHVIHISFANDTSHIVSWYEDIFEEIARRYKLDCTMDVHDDIIRHRVIMNFRQDGVSVEQIQKSIRSMVKDGNFSADLIVIDGYDFNRVSVAEFSAFKVLAEELGIEIWFSATLHRDSSYKNGIPSLLSPILEDIAILILLEPREDYIHLKLVKDHEITPSEDLHLKLDPQILLIAEKG
ncbi:MAG: hypothetical protein GX640_03390, partial [Fibrobacter sp.]|nr:hypothetical protein [Fibrobacter sp.]